MSAWATPKPRVVHYISEDGDGKDHPYEARCSCGQFRVKSHSRATRLAAVFGHLHYVYQEAADNEVLPTEVKK